MRILALLALFHFSPAYAGGDGRAFDAWSASDYSYCDVTILAQHWGGDAYDAKIKVGKQLLKGKEPLVVSALQQARTSAMESGRVCPWMYTSFTSQDAARLAAHWETTLDDAKTRVERKVTAGGEQSVRMVLDNLGATEGHEHDMPTAPTTSTMDSCHTKMLRHLWGMNAMEVQAYAERKISDGYGPYIEQEVAEARQLAAASPRVACAFYDTPYTLNDAELLAARWGTTVTDTKTRIERKYMHGHEGWLVDEVAAVRAQ